MIKRLAAATVVAGVLAGVAAPVVAQERPSFPTGAVDEFRVKPGDGTFIRWDGRPFAGELIVRSAPDGIVIVEDIGVDGYLAGIREVPLSWPAEALAAQAVAARTYLAWTLQRGRSSSGHTYGFDICATTACQVYRGAGVVLGTDGERWLDAIDRTAGEILVFGGVPVQALYHSTSGGQTEPVEDIFAGSTPKPYLQGVPSPEDSPLLDWNFELPADVFVEVLRAGGLEVGSELVRLDVEEQAAGEGVWDARLETSSGVTRLGVDRVRAIFNVHGPARFPGLLPAARPDGRRYPQAILSYRFELTYQAPDVAPSIRLRALLPDSDLATEGRVRLEGRGWGHHVGMSQFGAKAMADAGSSYPEILAHYYGALEPTDAEELLEEDVTVGLASGLRSASFQATGPFTLVADGEAWSFDTGLEWTVSQSGSGIVFRSEELFIARLLERLGRLIGLR